MFKRKLRFFLHRWHRRLGLAAALVVILVSITGVMLNHTGSLSLAKHYPQSAFWLWPYPKDANMGFVFDTHVLQQTHQSVLLDGKTISQCEPPLRSAVNVSAPQNQLWVLCQRNLLFFQQGQLVEVIDRSLLGNDVTHLADSDNGLSIQDGDLWYSLDTITMQPLAVVQAPESVPELTRLPDHLQRNHSISWQKIIQDLHSGRFFGKAGVFVVDAAAMILLLLALSGFWIWYSRRR